METLHFIVGSSSPLSVQSHTIPIFHANNRQIIQIHVFQPTTNKEKQITWDLNGKNEVVSGMISIAIRRIRWCFHGRLMLLQNIGVFLCWWEKCGSIWIRIYRIDMDPSWDIWLHDFHENTVGGLRPWWIPTARAVSHRTCRVVPSWPTMPRSGSRGSSGVSGGRNGWNI